MRLVAVFMVCLGLGNDWKRVSGSGCADECAEDSLDHEFVSGDQIGIIGILGTKEGAARLDEVALERDRSVDEGGHDVTVAGFRNLEDDGITVQDAGTDHGVSPHFEGEGLGVPG